MTLSSQSMPDQCEDNAAGRFRAGLLGVASALGRRSAYRHLVAELDMLPESVQADVGCSAEELAKLRARSSR